MDPINKPPSSLDVTKLPPRKPSPRVGMDTNAPNTSGQSPCNPQFKMKAKSFYFLRLLFRKNIFKF